MDSARGNGALPTCLKSSFKRFNKHVDGGA